MPVGSTYFALEIKLFMTFHRLPKSWADYFPVSSMNRGNPRPGQRLEPPPDPSLGSVTHAQDALDLVERHRRSNLKRKCCEPFREEFDKQAKQAKHTHMQACKNMQKHAKTRGNFSMISLGEREVKEDSELSVIYL